MCICLPHELEARDGAALLQRQREALLSRQRACKLRPPHLSVWVIPRKGLTSQKAPCQLKQLGPNALPDVCPSPASGAGQVLGAGAMDAGTGVFAAEIGFAFVLDEVKYRAFTRLDLTLPKRCRPAQGSRPAGSSWGIFGKAVDDKRGQGEQQANQRQAMPPGMIRGDGADRRTGCSTGKVAPHEHRVEPAARLGG